MLVYGELATSAYVCPWLATRGNSCHSRSASKPTRPAILVPLLKPELAYTQLLLLVTTYGTVLSDPAPACDVNWMPIKDCSGRFTGASRHSVVVRPGLLAVIGSTGLGGSDDL